MSYSHRKPFPLRLNYLSSCETDLLWWGLSNRQNEDFSAPALGRSNQQHKTFQAFFACKHTPRKRSKLTFFAPTTRDITTTPLLGAFCIVPARLARQKTVFKMEGNASLTDPGFKESLSFKIFKITFYSIILLLCLIGNFMVVLTVCRTRRMRMPSNLLILNLAICDLIIPITSIPFDLALEENDYIWPFGRALCKTLFPLATLSATAASLTLAMISFDRYRVIMHPFKQRLNSRQVKFSIALTHMMGLLFVIPYVYHLDLIPSIQGQTCEETWPTFSYRQAYTLFLFIVQYGIPLVFMSVIYSITLLNLHGSSSRFDNPTCDKGKYTGHQRKISLQIEATAANSNINSVRLDIDYRKTSRETIGQRHDVLARDQNIRATKMFVTVVIVFATCRLPNEIFWLWSDFGDGHQSQYSNNAGIICRMFTYMNSIFNPVIYWAFSKDFKKGFKEIFTRKRHGIWDDELDDENWYKKFSTLSDSISTVWRKISRSRSESSNHYEIRENNHGLLHQAYTNRTPSNCNDHVSFCAKENVLAQYGDQMDLKRTRNLLKTDQFNVLPNESLFLPSQSKLAKLSEESIIDAGNQEEVAKTKTRRFGTVLPPGSCDTKEDCQTISKITRPLSDEIDPPFCSGKELDNTIVENPQEHMLSPGSKKSSDGKGVYMILADNSDNTESGDKQSISSLVENGNYHKQPSSDGILSSAQNSDNLLEENDYTNIITNSETSKNILEGLPPEKESMLFLEQLFSLNMNLNGIKETSC